MTDKTPDILVKILNRKREEITECSQKTPLRDLVPKLKTASPVRGFVKSIENKLAANVPAVISEIKKASPSKGVICENFEPARIAKSYEQAGAACLSVLTDIDFFQGSDEYLIEARESVAIPVIRKDFIIDEWQIEESRYLGADCILLILSCLSFDQAKEYEEYAFSLGMNVIVEVHDLQELELANKLKARLIGINNRNLKTMDVNISTSINLINYIEKSKIPISESGISNSKDLENLVQSGFNTFLIGEAFMKENNIAKMFKNLKAIDV